MKNPSIGSPDVWAEFGLQGLVIFALFSILIGVLWFMLKRFDTIDVRHNEAIKGIYKAHKEERDEWRENSVRHADKLEQALTRLTDGIRDTRRNN